MVDVCLRKKDCFGLRSLMFLSIWFNFDLLKYPFGLGLNFIDRYTDLRGMGTTNLIFKIWRKIGRIIHLCQCTEKGPLKFHLLGKDFGTSLWHFECTLYKLNFRLNYSTATEMSSQNYLRKCYLLSLIATEIDLKISGFLRIAELS